MTQLNNYATLLGGKATGNRISCPGPGHSKDDRSLLVRFKDDGTFTVTTFANDDWQVCRDYVKSRLGLSDYQPIAAPVPAPIIPIDSNKNLGFAMETWRQSVPLSGTIAEAYLSSRGLEYSGTALRFHRACKFGTARYPAMVALMTDALTGEPTGVHRTALLPDGSDKAAPGKRMLGNSRGAVVRLSDDAEVTSGLGIAEGIETALAAPFRPVWACLNAGGLKALPIIEGVESLTIFADHDAAGLDAANDCGARWHDAGREVTIVAPTAVGADMADLAVAA